MPERTAPKRSIERHPAPQPGQARAIEVLDRDLIVSAGAGSGKTWVLTERYLEMLNHGTHPEQIIAITFTKKAAAEMKGRIRQAIVKMERTSRDQAEAAYWNACRQALERAVITTIHGFCTRLLRDAPLEAGVDPDFRILDEKEAVLMERRIFADTVDGWLAAGGSAAEAVYRDLGGRRAVLESALALHAFMRTYHVGAEQMLQETFTTLDRRRAAFQRYKAELGSLVTEARPLVHELLDERNNPPKYLLDAQNWLTKLETALAEARRWDGTYDREKNDAFTALKGSLWRNAGPDELKRMRQRFSETLIEMLNHVEAPEYRRLLRVLLEITAAAAAEYEEAKRHEQVLDFNDLERLSLDMLQRHPEVAGRWQQKIRCVMVDEFQDTNELQKRILDRLTKGPKNSEVTRFVVGDGKQSIYKFRGADVAVFHRAAAEILEAGGEAVSLDVNFRTQHRLIAYINSLFKFLMKKEADDPDYVTPYEPLTAFRKPPHTAPVVELLATAIEEDSDLDPRQHEAERLARRLRAMVEGSEPLVWEQAETGERPRAVTYGDIACLFAVRTHLQVYEQAFQNENIPYVVLGGQGFYERQEVLDVINVLKFVQNRDDEVALLGFLRSPFVHLSDETLYWLTRENRLSQAFFYLEAPPAEVAAKQWGQLLRARERFRRWERMKRTENVHRLMRAILDETGYLAILLAAENGEQAALNVEKLLDIARDMARAGRSLFDFLEWIDMMRKEALFETEAEWVRERENAVALMTVHASKGLEFPVVVLPDMSRQVLGRGAGGRVLYVPGSGLAARLARERGEPEGDGLFDDLRDMERDRELQEAYRLFYVATTRARDYLLFAGSQKEQKNPREDRKHEWLDWVVKHLGGKQLSDLPAGAMAPEADWSLKVTWDLEEGEADTSASETEAASAQNSCEAASHGQRAAHSHCDTAAALSPLYAPLQVQEESDDGSYAVSALIDYTVCPRLYVLKHQLKLPPMPHAGKITEEEATDARLSAVDIGNVLHRVMERIEGAADLEALVRDACLAEGIEASLQNEVSPVVLSLAANYCSSDYYRRSEHAVRVYNELPFHYRLGQWVVTGVVDKLFVDGEGTATLLDFKTNRVRDEHHFHKLCVMYEIQLQLYADAVQQLLKIPVKEAVLYFLQNDRPVLVPVDPPHLRQKRYGWEKALADMRRLATSSALPDCADESCPCRQYL